MVKDSTVTLDGEELWAWSGGTGGGTNQCGRGSPELVHHISVEIEHTGNIGILRVTTTLDQTAEDESFAVYLLLKQKIRRSDITLYISHGIGKNKKGAPKRPPWVEADDDNDIAGGGVEAGGTRSQPSNPPNLLSGKRATF